MLGFFFFFSFLSQQGPRPLPRIPQGLAHITKELTNEAGPAILGKPPPPTPPKKLPTQHSSTYFFIHFILGYSRRKCSHLASQTRATLISLYMVHHYILFTIVVSLDMQ